MSTLTRIDYQPIFPTNPLRGLRVGTAIAVGNQAELVDDVNSVIPPATATTAWTAFAANVLGVPAVLQNERQLFGYTFGYSVAGLNIPARVALSANVTGAGGAGARGALNVRVVYVIDPYAVTPTRRVLGDFTTQDFALDAVAITRVTGAFLVRQVDEDGEAFAGFSPGSLLNFEIVPTVTVAGAAAPLVAMSLEHAATGAADRLVVELMT